MTYAIVFSSKTGNTKLLAETIQHTLLSDCIYFGEPNEEALKADCLYVGFWTDKGTCTKEIGTFLKSINNKEIFLFGTCGFGQSTSYFDKVIETASKNINDSNKIIGSFMCQGQMPISVKERYEKMLKSPVPIPNIKNLIENFDQALGHPNQDDINKLIETIK